jgi:hypothetical protein
MPRYFELGLLTFVPSLHRSAFLFSLPGGGAPTGSFPAKNGRVYAECPQAKISVKLGETQTQLLLNSPDTLYLKTVSGAAACSESQPAVTGFNGATAPFLSAVRPYKLDGAKERWRGKEHAISAWDRIYGRMWRTHIRMQLPLPVLSRARRLTLRWARPGLRCAGLVHVLPLDPLDAARLRPTAPCKLRSHCHSSIHVIRPGRQVSVAR